MKLFRIAAYFVLLTVVLQLADGPFVVHQSGQAYLQQQIALASAQTNQESVQQVKLFDPHYSHGSIDEILTDMADMPQHIELPSIRPHSQPNKGTMQSFVSITAPPLDRPPALSLS
jgi:hypothetical protein